MKRKILIVGHGYFGGHLSKLLNQPAQSASEPPGKSLNGENGLKIAFDVTVTTRRRAKLAQYADAGMKAILLDVTDPPNEPGSEIPQTFDSIVYCVGYDRTQDLSHREVYAEGLRKFLTRLKHPPGKFIYVSSTGVYGQQQGEWTTEESTTDPMRESGQACLEAENLLLHSDLPSQILITRFAGIYGPGRVPNLAKLTSDPLEIPADGFLNLIHVRDAAGWTRELLLDQQIRGNRIFNVSDGHPVQRRDFYREAARFAGLPCPRFTEPAGNSNFERSSANKRISNARIVNETKYQLNYPDYQKGLEAIFAGENSLEIN